MAAEENDIQGIITNIQHYTIHDGPGIRTELFFKGCPMRCLWCSNPETLTTGPQLAVYPKKCLTTQNCGQCLQECPLNGGAPISFRDGELLPVKMARHCAGCLKCAAACPAEAIAVWGESCTVSRLMDEILKDRDFYSRSNGGVTFNGGEVMVQWKFAVILAEACHEAGVNVCVESALHCAPEHMDAVMSRADYIIADLKHMDSATHKTLTGVGNEVVLENLRGLLRYDKPVVLRTPVVIGYNDDEENIRAIAAFIKEDLRGRIIQYQLLPYRKMGTEKYASLGMTYPMEDYAPPQREVWEKRILALRDMAQREFGVPAVAGSNHKWL